MRIRPNCDNPGLLLHKGLDFLFDPDNTGEANKKRLEDAKAAYWDRLVAKSGATPSGYSDYLADVTAALGPGREFTFDRRIVVGLGVQTPGERGVSLHGLFGTPVFPGSGIKGVMVREALAGLGLEAFLPPKADQPIPWRDLPGAPATALWQMQALFGDVDGAGRLRVFDALWVPGGAAFLRSNVDTQHNRIYYRDQNVWPNDTDGPNPIRSVTLAKGIRMRFWLDAGDWTDIAYDLLRRALENRGLGAKSSAGYGRLSPPPPPPPPVPTFVVSVRSNRNGTVQADHGREARTVRGAPADLRVGAQIRVTFDGRFLHYVAPADL